jgi:tetratricopeptide (TPR) repeat protein
MIHSHHRHFAQPGLIALLTFALFTGIGSRSGVAAGGPRAEARRHFERGAQAYREARYPEAIDAFLAAFRLDPDPGLVFNVGQAWEKLGNVANALRSYREYLRLSPRADDRPTVEASVRNLEARLRERGVQQVSVYSSPAGADVVLDGRALGRTPWTGEIAPGRHALVLRLAGHGEARKEFVLRPDRAMDLDVDLSSPVLPGDAATRTRVPPLLGSGAGPAKRRAANRRVRPWTATLLASSVALLGSSLGCELARRGSESAARDAATQIEFRARYDEAVVRQTASRALLGAGLAAAVTSAVLLYLDLRPRRGRERPTATLGCGPTGCSFTFTHAF